MRVVYFTDTFLPQVNGVTKTLTRLLDYWDEKGVEHLVLAPDQKEKDYFSYNVERFFSLRLLFYPECRISFPNFFRMNAKIKEFRPDLIHIITEFNMGLAGLRYGERNQVPVATTFTTNFPNYLQYYNLQFLDKMCWDYERWVHNRGEKTFCPSNETKKLLNKQGIQKVGLWSRGIDCGLFHPGHKNIEWRRSLGMEDKIIFTYVGRISVEKDLDILQETYQNLRNLYQDKIALIMVGDGPMAEKCKEDFPKDTLFLGYKKGKELAEIYASSDIFIFPSTTETLGNVVLEGMASGIPILGAGVGGVLDNLHHRENGLLCKPRNVGDFTMSAIELVENHRLRNQLGRQARQYAEQKSWKKVFEGLHTDYKEIIERYKYRKLPA